MWARAQANRGGGLRQESLAWGLQAQGREQHPSAEPVEPLWSPGGVWGSHPVLE